MVGLGPAVIDPSGVTPAGGWGVSVNVMEGVGEMVTVCVQVGPNACAGVLVAVGVPSIGTCVGGG